MELPFNLGWLVRMARGPGALTLGTSLAGQFFMLISGVIAARALGVEGRGTLALLWLLPVILALLGGIGIPQATTYFVAREERNVGRVILMSLHVTVFLAVGLSLLYALGLMLYSGESHNFALADAAMSVALVPLFLGQNLAIASLLGQERYRAYNAARLIPVVIYAVLSLGLVALGHATLTTILMVATSGWVVALVFSWVMIVRRLPAPTGAPMVARRGIVSFGLRGVIGSVSPIDDVRLDQFMVGLLLDAHALGLYVSAVAFCNIQKFMAQAVGAVSYPRISAERRGPQAWGLTARYFRIGLLLIAGCTVALLLLLPVLLPLLFGDDFSEAVGMGRILLAGTFLLAIHRLMTELARGLGRPGYGSISEAVNAAAFLLVVFLVLNPVSATGIAWAVLAGGLCCAGLLGFLILRLRRPLVAGHPNEQGSRLAGKPDA